jgi:2-polyprenyl-6-methoxyphenol hydroxylase-like FAD-dependent oxidoreductase
VTRVPRTDIAVLGGGPAGSAVAYRLARLGYRVLLVTADRPDGMDRTEVLPPSIETLQGAFPLGPALADQPLAPLTRGRWSGFGEDVRPHPGTRLVQRVSFDRSLLQIAAAAGVELIESARARRPHRTPDGWMVPIDRAGDRCSVTARILVDAAGRRGGFARNSRLLAAATVALCARWTPAAIRAGEIWVEALPDGWCWSAGVADGVLEAATFVSMAECRGLGLQALRRRHCQLLLQSERFSAALHGAVPGPVRVCDATARIDEDPAQPDLIRVGDAAFAPDPMSSQGVQAALRSAVQAAAAVHTILSGGDAEAAISFYQDAVQAVAMRHRTATAELYAGHQRWRDHPFWRARAEHVTDAPAPSVPIQPMAADPALRLSRDVEIVAAPALVGDMIERMPSVMHRSEPRPVTWLNGHLLAPLLDRMGSGERASAILAGWSATMPADEASSVLQWLMARGIVEPGPPPS